TDIDWSSFQSDGNNRLCDKLYYPVRTTARVFPQTRKCCTTSSEAAYPRGSADASTFLLLLHRLNGPSAASLFEDTHQKLSSFHPLLILPETKSIENICTPLNSSLHTRAFLFIAQGPVVISLVVTTEL
ncbi:hypothetical protein TYRP_006101, partial [Tyrophagus putrescentiae]